MKKIYVSPTVELYDFIGEEDMLTSSNPDPNPIATVNRTQDPDNTDWTMQYEGELTDDDESDGIFSVPFTF